MTQGAPERLHSSIVILGLPFVPRMPACNIHRLPRHDLLSPAQGFHKAVKKHDKQLPHAPCQQFYMHILRTQPWVQGDQSSLLVKLSAIYAQLRGQPAETAVAEVSAVLSDETIPTQTLLNPNPALDVALVALRPGFSMRMTALRWLNLRNI